jgi:hypothetical protein
MKKVLTFSEILEAADTLTPDEQEEIINILRRRANERRRKELLKDIRKTEKDFKDGKCRTGTANELMKEVLS